MFCCLVNLYSLFNLQGQKFQGSRGAMLHLFGKQFSFLLAFQPWLDLNSQYSWLFTFKTNLSALIYCYCSWYILFSPRLPLFWLFWIIMDIIEKQFRPTNMTPSVTLNTHIFLALLLFEKLFYIIGTGPVKTKRIYFLYQNDRLTLNLRFRLFLY